MLGRFTGEGCASIWASWWYKKPYARHLQLAPNWKDLIYVLWSSFLWNKEDQMEKFWQLIVLLTKQSEPYCQFSKGEFCRKNLLGQTQQNTNTSNPRAIKRNIYIYILSLCGRPQFFKFGHIKIITMCSSIDFKGDDFKVVVYDYMQSGSLEDWLQQSNNQVEGNLISFKD